MLGFTQILGDAWPSGTFTKVAVGDQHACAIRADGRLLCWGTDGDGRAPPGPSQDTFVDVSAGSKHTCAVRSDGKMLCWGDDLWGVAPRP